MKKVEEFKDINAFKMDISYTELDSASPKNIHSHHIHNECEIYVNISGDVSFAVEDSLYPIVPGSVIITRPYEYHHCIYHSNKLHKHFWILLQSAGNEGLFDIFYKRELGKNNLLMLDAQNSDELINICHRLNNGIEDDTEKYYCFFKMMSLLNNATRLNTAKDSYNNSILKAIDYINTNFSAKISVGELAKLCNCSISTIERHFGEAFALSPSEYIKQRRLASATKMLSEGRSVTDAAYCSGFSDCSKFIGAFKKAYGITPLQYKKSCIEKKVL